MNGGEEDHRSVKCSVAKRAISEGSEVGGREESSDVWSSEMWVFDW